MNLKTDSEIGPSTSKNFLCLLRIETDLCDTKDVKTHVLPEHSLSEFVGDPT